MGKPISNNGQDPLKWVTGIVEEMYRIMPVAENEAVAKAMAFVPWHVQKRMNQSASSMAKRVIRDNVLSGRFKIEDGLLQPGRPLRKQIQHERMLAIVDWLRTNPTFKTKIAIPSELEFHVDWSVGHFWAVMKRLADIGWMECRREDGQYSCLWKGPDKENMPDQDDLLELTSVRLHIGEKQNPKADVTPRLTK